MTAPMSQSLTRSSVGTVILWILGLLRCTVSDGARTGMMGDAIITVTMAIEIGA